MGDNSIWGRTASLPTPQKSRTTKKNEILSQVDAGILHKAQSTSKVKNAIASFMSLLQTGVKKDWAIENVELGKGKFGVVRLCTNRKTGQPAAIKIMQKRDKDDKEMKLMMREIEIMKNVKHQNCIDFYAMYESRNHIYIIMEVVTGGQLLDRIIEKEHYSETEAAHVFVQMISAIEYLHSVGIVHRDLKPENILYANLRPDSPIKICDFGLGKLVELRELQSGRIRLWSRCGSPNYVAPEILLRKGYGMECDVWSAGVILFITLSGAPPFDQASVDKKFAHIKKADFVFPDRQWAGISEEVKDLIRHMLCLDVQDRFTCKRCLDHPWCKRFEAGDLPREGMPAMQSRLREWNAQRKLMAAIHTCTALGRMAHICEQPNQEECAERLAQLKLDPVRLAELRESFELLDCEHRGSITIESLAHSMAALGQQKSEEELREMLDQFCVFHQEELCFEEFCIMMCPRSHDDHHSPHTSAADDSVVPDSHLRGRAHSSDHGQGGHSQYSGSDEHLTAPYSEEEVEQTFRALDLEKSGKITPQMLKEVLTRFGATVTDEEAREMVRTADTKGEGVIDLDDFRRLLHTEEAHHAEFMSPTAAPVVPPDGVPPMLGFQRQMSSPM
mmetsp:Transcript_50311/g.118385  ORF Transcript_50311/g.118385 Transcript_50311/m.118385 type:complete len:617 (+) Transcript_50311:196-2046(+)